MLLRITYVGGGEYVLTDEDQLTFGRVELSEQGVHINTMKSHLAVAQEAVEYILETAEQDTGGSHWSFNTYNCVLSPEEGAHAAVVHQLKQIINHVYASRQELIRALNAAGKQWSHQADVRVIIKRIDELDGLLREEWHQAMQPRVKPRLTLLKGAKANDGEAS